MYITCWPGKRCHNIAINVCLFSDRLPNNFEILSDDESNRTEKSGNDLYEPRTLCDSLWWRI